MAQSRWLEPCADANHQTCGCRFNANKCCLRCPLEQCVLDGVGDPLRLRRYPGSKARQRGEAITELLALGRGPTAIRRALGLTGIQYSRAVKWLDANRALLVDSTTLLVDSTTPNGKDTGFDEPETTVQGQTHVA